jgi:hypothetical protein
VIKIDSVEALTVSARQYEIEADIKNERIEIPEEIGQRISITAKGMIVALNDPEYINKVIDELRLRNISIHSVQPMRRTLEQSFFDAVADDVEPEA